MSESFPATRLRRLRRTPAIRRLFKEVDVGLEHLVQPYFVVSGKGVMRETSAGSGLWQVSGDVLAEEVQQMHRAGVGGVMLFGVPDTKWSQGSLEPAMRDYLAAIALARKVTPDAVIMSDVCLCSLSSWRDTRRRRPSFNERRHAALCCKATAWRLRQLSPPYARRVGCEQC